VVERKLLIHIHKQFPHEELLSIFSMFEIEAIIQLKEDQILKYGNQHLFKLEEQLGKTKKSYIGQYCKVSLNFDKNKNNTAL